MHVKRCVSVMFLLVFASVWLGCLNTAGGDEMSEMVSMRGEGGPAADESGVGTGGASGRSTSSPWSGLLWPRFCHDDQHGGAIPAPGPATNTLLWSNDTGEEVYSTPTIADGKVFVGTKEGRVIAYDPLTGQELWNTFLASSSQYGVVSSPAYSDGHVVVYNNPDNTIYRLNATDGSEDWSTYTSGAIDGGSSAAITNGTVWIGTPDDNLYCLDEQTGDVRWSYDTGSGMTRDYGVMSPVVDDTHVYAASCSGYLWCFKRDNPTSSPDYVWRTFMTDSMLGSPMLHGKYVYMGVGVYESQEGSIKSFEMKMMWKSNGTVKHAYKTGDHIISTPTYHNNTIYFGSLDTYFYALNANDLSLKWKFKTDDMVYSSGAIADDRVYFTSMDADVYCLDADTGSKIWNFTMGAETWAGCSIANGILYTGGIDHKIYAIGVPDTTPPRVKATDPAANAVGVPVTKALTLTFNEAMDPETIENSSFELDDPGSLPVPGTVEYGFGTRTLTFTPDAPLEREAIYTARLLASVGDWAGNTLDGDKDGTSEGSPADDHHWSFTTSDNIPPELTSGAVDPPTGDMDAKFTYTVEYLDLEDDGPAGDGFIRVHIDNDTGHDMDLDTSAPAALQDGDYTNGESFTFSTALDLSGSHSYYFNASDGRDTVKTAMASGPYIPNISPEFGDIPDQKALEDTHKVIELGPYITDADTPAVDLVLTEDSEYGTVSGLNITLLYPDGVLEEDIALDVFDGLTHVRKDMHVDVKPVNDPPVMAGVPDILATAGVDRPLDLEPFISDIDNTMEELEVSTSSDHGAVGGFQVTFNYPRDFGTELVTLTVSDGEAQGSQVIEVEVRTEPAPPVIRAIPPLQAVEDIPLKIELEDHISDLDTPFEELLIAEDSAYAEVKGGLLVLRYPDGVFSDGFDLTVRDDGGEPREAVMAVTVTVTPVNDAPELLSPGVEPGEGPADTRFTFAVTYRDIDGGDSPSVNVEVDGVASPMTLAEGELTAGAVFSLTGTFDMGEHTYRFTADDGTGTDTARNSTESATFTVVDQDGPGDDGGDGQDGGDGEDGEGDGSGGGSGDGTGSGDADREGAGTTGTIVNITAILTAIVVAVIILVMVLRKRRPPRGDEGADADGLAEADDTPEGGGPTEADGNTEADEGASPEGTEDGGSGGEDPARDGKAEVEGLEGEDGRAEVEGLAVGEGEGSEERAEAAGSPPRASPVAPQAPRATPLTSE